MSSIALYYPWMHFQSDDWVKLSLLTWDGVMRIRPNDLPARDSDLVRQVRAESDLITDITPTPRDLGVVMGTFTQVIADHREAIVVRHRHHPESAQPDERWGEMPMCQPGDYAMPASNTGGRYAPVDPRSFWVYCGGDTGNGKKIADTLRDELVRCELAVESSDGRPWLGMRPELGYIYLAVLADAMSRHNSLSPASDNPRVHHAPGSLDQLTALLLGTTDRSPSLTDVQDAYLHVALRAVIEPERLAEVSATKIIKFRQRHAAELATFRAHIAGLGEELTRVAKVENLHVAQKHLEVIYRQQTAPQLTELRRALRSLGVESTAGSLALRVDLNAATGTVLGGIAAAGGQLTVAGAAVVVAVVPYLASKFRDRRDRVASSPVHTCSPPTGNSPAGACCARCCRRQAIA